MSHVMTAPKRGRGRPQVRSDEESRSVIAAAARDVFVASGYTNASMDEVAKAAAVSKKTLYRLVPTKAELFKASIADRIANFMLALDEERLVALPAETALVRLLTEYGSLTMAPDTIAIQKLVYSESSRFPELAAEFHQGAVTATERVFVRVLRRLRDAGLIAVDDLDDTAGMLKGMMIFERSRNTMLGQQPPPSPAEIQTRAERCARLFLYGCRPAKQAT